MRRVDGRSDPDPGAFVGRMIGPITTRLVSVGVLFILCLITPGSIAAVEVDRNAVILKEVRVLKDSKGRPIANELIYVGGIGSQSASLAHARPFATLREIHPLAGKITLSEGKVVITVRKLPIVMGGDGDSASPAAGRWDFFVGDRSSYADAVHVTMGGDLDILYQSTGMRKGDHDSVLHYGLGGNPHAVSLSRKRLEQAFASQAASQPKPTLDYEPASDVILVHIQLTREGLLFQPLFDYDVVK